MNCEPDDDELKLVCEGAAGAVRFTADVFQKYTSAIEGNDETSIRRRVHLARYFSLFCDNKDYVRKLNDEKFKKEGNFPDGAHGQIAIYTFKAWQWRVYGAIIHLNQQRCFVGTRVDAFKKRNKANKQLLEGAASDIGKMMRTKAKGQ